MNVLRFVNRLSDYFFALARKEVFRINGEEVVWTSTTKTCSPYLLPAFSLILFAPYLR